MGVTGIAHCIIFFSIYTLLVNIVSHDFFGLTMLTNQVTMNKTLIVKMTDESIVAHFWWRIADVGFGLYILGR